MNLSKGKFEIKIIYFYFFLLILFLLIINCIKPNLFHSKPYLQSFTKNIHVCGTHCLTIEFNGMTEIEKIEMAEVLSTMYIINRIRAANASIQYTSIEYLFTDFFFSRVIYSCSQTITILF